VFYSRAEKSWLSLSARNSARTKSPTYQAKARWAKSIVREI